MQAGIRAVVGWARRRRNLFVAAFTALALLNVWLWIGLLQFEENAASVETTIAIAVGTIAAFALYMIWRNPAAAAAATAGTPSLRFALATHQAGHIVAGFIDDPNRLRKVQLYGPCATRASVVPLSTHQSMRTEMTIRLAGMAAEEIFTGESSSFAADDLAGATALGADMVGRFGMGGSLVSLATGRMRRYRFMERTLEDARTRKELEALLRDSKRESMRLMLENRHLIIALRDELLRREQLTTTDIQLLFDEARSEREDADEVLVDLRIASDRNRPVVKIARS